MKLISGTTASHVVRRVVYPHGLVLEDASVLQQQPVAFCVREFRGCIVGVQYAREKVIFQLREEGLQAR